MRNKNLAAAALAFAGTCALPFMLHIKGDHLGYTNSAVSVFVCLFLFWLMKRILRSGFRGSLKRWFLPGGFGLLFSLCMVFGTRLDLKGSVPFKEMGMWAAIAALAVISAIVVRYCWDLLGKTGSRKAAEDGKHREASGEKQVCHRPAVRKADRGPSRGEPWKKGGSALSLGQAPYCFAICPCSWLFIRDFLCMMPRTSICRWLPGIFLRTILFCMCSF